MQLKLSVYSLRTFLPFFASLAIVLTGFYRVAESPPLWWDEGWTISVASNFINTGHYGQINAGLEVPPGLSGHDPVILAAALSFRIFGDGIWQARLPFVVLTLIGLSVVYRFTFNWEGQRAAWGALVAVLLMVPHPMIHPLLNGRQVLGDIPAALLLIAGALSFGRSRLPATRFVDLPLAVLLWGIALATKAQVMVFGGLGLIITCALLFMKNERRSALALLLTGMGSFIFFRLLSHGLSDTLRGGGYTNESVDGLVWIVGIVPVAGIRLRALLLVGVFAIPFVLGLASEAIRVLKSITYARAPSDPSALLIWAVASSWIAWYLLLSNSGDRYLATPILLAAPFAGRWLRDASRGFNMGATIRRAAAAMRFQDRSWDAWRSLAAAVLILIYLPATLISTYLGLGGNNDALLETAAFVNARVPSNGLVETYDSELFLFLDPYVHFPPDQVHFELLRSTVYSTPVDVDYDPLVIDPELVIVGPNSAAWGLYDQMIASGAIFQIADFGRYQVYQPAGMYRP